jgi:glycosyltransferase involved in cell wall biosynthesis
MPSRPSISVVTIAYNQGSYLRACIESVAFQQYPFIQHLIVDPGSTDDTPSLLAKSAAQYSHILPVYKQDSGPPEGLNNGIRTSTGDYLIFLNADDYLLPGSILSIVDAIMRYPPIDILFFGGYRLYQDSSCLIYNPPCIPSLHMLAAGLTILFQQGLVVSSSCVRQTKLFNPFNHTCWDFEFVCEILSIPCIKSKRIFTPIAVFRLHSNSITGKGGNAIQYSCDRRIVQSHYIPQSFSYLLNFTPLLNIFILPLKYILDLPACAMRVYFFLKFSLRRVR